MTKCKKCNTRRQVFTPEAVAQAREKIIAHDNFQKDPLKVIEAQNRKPIEVDEIHGRYFVVWERAEDKEKPHPIHSFSKRKDAEEWLLKFKQIFGERSEKEYFYKITEEWEKEESE